MSPPGSQGVSMPIGLKLCALEGYTQTDKQSYFGGIPQNKKNWTFRLKIAKSLTLIFFRFDGVMVQGVDMLSSDSKFEPAGPSLSDELQTKDLWFTEADRGTDREKYFFYLECIWRKPKGWKHSKVQLTAWWRSCIQTEKHKSANEYTLCINV